LPAAGVTVYPPYGNYNRLFTYAII